jgi:acyl dehydratase
MRAMRWEPTAVGTRASFPRTITERDVELFAESTGDRNPLHFDAEFPCDRGVAGDCGLHGAARRLRCRAAEVPGR